MTYATRKYQGLLVTGAMTFMALSSLTLVYMINVIDEKVWILYAFGSIWWSATACWFLQAFAPYAHYRVENGQLFLRSAFRKKAIGLQEITDCLLISEKQATKLVNQANSEMVQGEADLDIQNWWRGAKKLGELTSFCSVQFAHSHKTTGNDRNVTDIKTYAKGRFVLVETKSGHRYLLSPKDPGKLQAAISGGMLGSTWAA